MAESMRGTRLGALSYETDSQVEPAERLPIAYECEAGHRTVVPFSIEAEEVPYDWVCRCGRLAVRPDVRAPESAPVKPPRSHWDMLMERRTRADLEALLAERLELLHMLRDEADPLPRSA